MNVVVHDVNLVSVQTSNIREFIYNNVTTIKSGHKYIYLWLSHREYNIDFTTKVLTPKRELAEVENFIYSIVFDNNYVEIINEISDGYNEFQFWELCFTNTEIKEYRLYDYPDSPGKNHKDGFLFYKGVEPNVIWIENRNAANAIIDFY